MRFAASLSSFLPAAILAATSFLPMPGITIAPAAAEGMVVHGCSGANIPKGPHARACVDAGFVILCGISGNYCCKQTSSGGVTECHAIVGMSEGNISHAPGDDAPPPQQLAPTSGGGAMVSVPRLPG